jgi:hypothetical protein
MREIATGDSFAILLPNGEDVCLDQVKTVMAWHYKQYQDEQNPLDREAYATAEMRGNESQGRVVERSPSGAAAGLSGTARTRPCCLTRTDAAGAASQQAGRLLETLGATFSSGQRARTIPRPRRTIRSPFRVRRPPKRPAIARPRTVRKSTPRAVRSRGAVPHAG